MARSIVDRWLNRLKASAREEIQETARSALLYLVAAVAGLMAIVFLTLAAFWSLAAELAPITSALIITAFYAAVAAAMLIWASWTGEAAALPKTAEQKPTIHEAEGYPRDMPDLMGVNLDSVAKSLADAGFRTESLVISASGDLLRQLTPLQFLGIVFVGSFLFGRRLRR